MAQSKPLTNKYLDRKGILDIIGEIIVPSDFEMISQDSYNETLIAEAIKETGKQSELFMAALNIAVIGAGNQRLGSFKLGLNVIDIAQLLTNCGFRLHLKPNSVLSERELTVQRLCRFYRFEIRNYLAQTGYPTYIFRKYSRGDAKYNQILFRGAEYIENLTVDELAYLQETINAMDQQLGTRFLDRFKRVRLSISGLTRQPIMDKPS